MSNKSQKTTSTYQVPTENTVNLSWKRYLLPPIHPEGLKILGVFLGVIVIIGLIYPAFWIIGAPVLAFVFYFFRNPERITPINENYIISPAHGIVSNIKYITPAPEMGLGDKPMLRISIFMSVFSVHVNRAPVSGTVSALKYGPGKFVSVADKDSEDNERQLITIDTKSGHKIGFIQIAGLVARRIYCPLTIGQEVVQGGVFGMIRFGSRLDVFLPDGVVPNVMLGQIAVAGETVLADMAKK